MTLEQLHHYLSAKVATVLDYPFGPDVRVYKVKGKMFALFDPADSPMRINLKCDPEEALILRDVFAAVLPGYHMNKRHWNTVILDGSLPDGEIERMIDSSFRLVVKGLKKAERDQVALLEAQARDGSAG